MLTSVRGQLLFLLLMLLSLPSMAQTDGDVIHRPEDFISGTLPVLYITTEDSVPITSKEEYVRAIWYLDAMGIKGVESFGNENEQYAMSIKGRGNSSWQWVKKPYRLKLDDEVPLLGMKADRHFVLLNEWRDGWGRIGWEMGFTVSRLMGLKWVPTQQPVELVLNGDYKGLYFLAEKIRVDKDRVNITKQEDKETDPELITGGWLCEIDNYASSPRVSIADRTTHVTFRTTIHSPENLSSAQRNYITNLIDAADKAIYCPDKTSTDWEQFIDLDYIARYYLACEIIYQIEGFSGSCYWSKDRGEDTKICFGPVWDFDTSNLKWTVQKFCYEQQENDEVKDRNHWISEVAKYPRFQQRVRELWQEWNDSAAATLEPHAADWMKRVEVAHMKDVERWYDYLKNFSNLQARFESYFRHFNTHQQWLAEQWSKPIPVIGDANDDRKVDGTDLRLVRQHLLNQPVDAFNVATANTYDDSVLDLSDLVGVLRQIYRNEHPGVVLPSPITLPYGQSDKDVDNSIRLSLCQSRDTVRFVASDIKEVPFTFTGAPASASAFQFDLSTKGLEVFNITLPDNLKATHRLHVSQLGENALRVIVYSDSLTHIDGSGQVPAFLMTVRCAAQPESANYSQSIIRFFNVRVVQSDMFPHYLADVEVPFTWRRVPIPGDVDSNGVVDIEDLNLMVNIMMKRSVIADFPYADANHSGSVDVDDVNMVINSMLRRTSILDVAVGNVHFKMVKLFGGSFTMGATPEQAEYAADNEQPPHRVTVSDFAIGQTEVTQELWEAVMGSNPSEFVGDPQRPVDNVSWDDCQVFIARLNQLTHMRFRLPTEAEWEFAARGGNSSIGYVYSGSNSAKKVAWHNGNSGLKSHPVAQKEPNELGLYDMSGNVWEWCADWYAHYSGPEAVTDPTGPETGTRRVCRGGCWWTLTNVCRVSFRTKFDSDTRLNRFGLRLAL